MPRTPDPVKSAGGRLASSRRWHPDNLAKIVEAHRLLNVARIERAITDILAEEGSPALTGEQRLFLANVLVTAGPLSADERNAAASLMATNGSLTDGHLPTSEATR